MKLIKSIILCGMIASHYYLPALAYCVSVPVTIYYANFVFHLWHDWSNWRKSNYRNENNILILAQERTCKTCYKMEIKDI